MKINRKILLVVITLVIAFAGCGKYDDGPKFSPWPKKWRLDGTWKIDSYVINGTSVSPTSNYTYQFTHNGGFIATDGSLSISGTWAWADSKGSLSITVDGSTDVYKILKLEMKQLWLQEPGSTDEDHYVPN